MIDLLVLFAVFLVGFFSIVTDRIVDDKLFLFKNAQYVTGLVYGVLLGWLLNASVEVATVLLAVSAGVFLAGKMDKHAHQAAAGAALLVLGLNGFAGANAVLLCVFVLFGLFDEYVNDFVDEAKRLKKKINAIVNLIGEHRLLLEACCFAVSAVTGEWLYFLVLLSYDVGGYVFAEFFARAKIRAQTGSLGQHLVLDLYDCSVSKLENEESLKKFLSVLPARIGMRKISRPLVKKVSNRLDEGLSGFVLLAESHVSVHTFPRLQSVNVDVFSCKPFDSTKVVKEVQEWFKARSVVERILKRRDLE
ncbi:MAG: S-adenosylmethionine decarboxylase [Candidatus Micrarchaeota archaeon]